MRLVKVCIKMDFGDVAMSELVCYRVTYTLQNLLKVYNENHASTKETQNSKPQSMPLSNVGSSVILSRLMKSYDFSHGVGMNLMHT